MTKVFISYSRRDRPFAKELSDMLIASGREVWIDLEDILPGAEWRPEIRAGIEESDVVLVLLSPDWVTSKHCAWELGHAVQHNRRLLPILFRDVDPQLAPASIEPLNWIPWRSPADRDHAFDRLIRAIETDLEWLHAITRLERQATEWSRRSREQSLLLHGRQLISAEELLAAASNHPDPQPTELQVEFVRASRNAERTRLQRVRVSAALSLLIIGLLGVIAWTQRTRANDEQAYADSRRLAATALSLLDSQLDTALLISAEAFATSATLESKISLFRSLAYSPELVAFLPIDGSPIETVTFSPDGKLLAVGTRLSVTIWDVTKRQVIASIPIRDARARPHSLAFNPDGTLLAWASIDGTTILDVGRAEPLGPPLKRGGAPTNSVVFSPDGAMFATGSGDLAAMGGGAPGEIAVWATATRALSGRPIIMTSHAVTSLAYSPDGSVLASGVNDGSGEKSLLLWDGGTHRPLDRPLGSRKSAQILSLAFSPDGKLLATGSERHGPASEGGEILLWDVARREVVSKPLTSKTLRVESLAFSPDGSYLLANGGLGDRDVLAWYVHPPGSARTFRGHPATVQAIAVSTDGQTLASGDAAGNLIVWDFRRSFPLGRQLKLGDTLYGEAVLDGDNFGTLTFSTDSATLIGYESPDRVTSWDIATGQNLGPVRQTTTGNIVEPRSQATHASLTVRAGEKIELLDHDSGVVLGTLDARAGSVAISPDGRLLVSHGFPSHGWMPHPPVLWDIDVEGWRGRVCMIANRNLSRAEWEQHLPGRPYRRTCVDLPDGS